MKRLIRARLIQERHLQPLKEISRYSEIILEGLMALPEYQEAKKIFTYVSGKNEVDTLYLIEMSLKNGKTVAVPKIYGKGLMKFYEIKSLDDLKIGRFELMEPVLTDHEAISDLETLIVIPGVAFDASKNRLGYGAGYYDRYLEAHQAMLKCALAYEFQMVPEIPKEPFDQKMDLIITEKYIYR